MKNVIVKNKRTDLPKVFVYLLESRRNGKRVVIDCSCSYSKDICVSTYKHSDISTVNFSLVFFHTCDFFSYKHSFTFYISLPGCLRLLNGGIVYVHWLEFYALSESEDVFIKICIYFSHSSLVIIY